MRSDPEGFHLVGLLVPNPGVDHVGGEDVAAEQEVVIGAGGRRARPQASGEPSARWRVLQAEDRRCPYLTGRRAILALMPSSAAISAWPRGAASKGWLRLSGPRYVDPAALGAGAVDRDRTTAARLREQL